MSSWEPADLALANELADLARPLAMAHFRKPLVVERKDDASPVTVADRAIEGALREVLGKRRPNHGIWGEEQGCEGANRPVVWVIDPIDGTSSYITGLPTFATLIGLVVEGCPVLGILDMPALGERWQGAWGHPTLHRHPTRQQGQPCRVAPRTDLAAAALFATTIDMFNRAQRQRFDALSRSVGMRRFGADAYAYGLLAAGFVDLVAEADLKPHDFLPLVPIVHGAGGVMSDWAGRPLTFHSDGQVLAAASPALHRAALTKLAPSQDFPIADGSPGAV